MVQTTTLSLRELLQPTLDGASITLETLYRVFEIKLQSSVTDSQLEIVDRVYVLMEKLGFDSDLGFKFN